MNGEQAFVVFVIVVGVPIAMALAWWTAHTLVHLVDHFRTGR